MTFSNDTGGKPHGGRRGEGTLLLTRSDVASLLTLDDCIGGVEAAFRLHAEGRTLPRRSSGSPRAMEAFTSRRRGSRWNAPGSR